MNLAQIIATAFSLAMGIVPSVQLAHHDGATKLQMVVAGLRGMLAVVPGVIPLLPANMESTLTKVAQTAYDVTKATGLLPPAIPVPPTV